LIRDKTVIKIRFEKPEDLPLIYSVIAQTFKRTAEAKLADNLRQACSDHLSLVAEDNGTIVGHIMFTPVLIKNGKEAQGMGLAPMAVLPSRQRQGIGILLVESGLQILREKGCPFVIVLGHPDYYPRFGFQPASRFNIRSQWEDVPDEAFMILVLDDNAMQNVSGIATFRDEFNDAQ
jgi:putative acetyltransferase